MNDRRFSHIYGTVFLNFLSDPDDFIVGDDGQPISGKKKKGQKHKYTDA